MLAEKRIRIDGFTLQVSPEPMEHGVDQAFGVRLSMALQVIVNLVEGRLLVPGLLLLILDRDRGE